MRYLHPLACLVIMASASAQELSDSSFGLLFRPGLPQETGTVRLFGDYLADAAIDAPNAGDYASIHYGGGVAINMFKTESMVLRSSFAGSLRELDVSDTIGLPDTIESLAIDLSAKHLLSQTRFLTWRIGLSSSSDEVFHSWEESEGAAELLILHMKPNRDAWLYGIIWRSRLVYPLPAIAYIWNANEQVRVTIGLPMLRINWQAREDLSLEAGLNGAGLSGNAELTWAPKKMLNLGWTLHQDTWNATPVATDGDADLDYEGWRTGAFVWVGHRYAGGIRLESGWGFARRLILENRSDDLFEAIFDNEERLLDADIDDGLYVSLSANLNF